jgi:NADH-quinone oxidoreductase subunit J
MMIEVLFYAFSAVLIGSAVGVIVSRNPVHSALFLVLAFFTSAAIWLMLDAEFLALLLVVVYVGAVMVLFLFVVMMLDINLQELRKGFTRYAPLGLLVSLIMVIEIVNVVWVKKLGLGLAQAAPPLPADYSNTEALGRVLYTEYVYPFQIAAAILLVAIVAAIVLTLRRRPGAKVQDVSKQVAVRRKDRVRLVKMESVKPSPPADEPPTDEPSGNRETAP